MKNRAINICKNCTRYHSWENGTGYCLSTLKQTKDNRYCNNWEGE